MASRVIGSSAAHSPSRRLVSARSISWSIGRGHDGAFEEDFVESAFAGHLDQSLNRNTLVPFDRAEEVGESIVSVVPTGASDEDHPLRKIAEACPGLVALMIQSSRRFSALAC